MSRYKNSQYARQEDLINNSDIFNGDKGNGYFMGRPRNFVLKDGMNNLYEPIRNDILRYFKDNEISWWGRDKPSKLVYAKKGKNRILHLHNSDYFSSTIGYYKK